MVIITRFVLNLTLVTSHFCSLLLFFAEKLLRGDLHICESEIKTRARKTIIQPKILGFLVC
jgi:hypothetical protein